MPNNEQEIVQDGAANVEVNIDLEEGNELTKQVVNNTKLLSSMLEQLKEINKTLKKIYNPE